jgi:hypothetical protein
LESIPIHIKGYAFQTDGIYEGVSFPNGWNIWMGMLSKRMEYMNGYAFQTDGIYEWVCFPNEWNIWMSMLSKRMEYMNGVGSCTSSSGTIVPLTLHNICFANFREGARPPLNPPLLYIKLTFTI